MIAKELALALRDQSGLYNLEERGVEYDLLPWVPATPHAAMPTPTARAARLANPVLKQIAARHGVTPAQVSMVDSASGWCPCDSKAVRPEHVQLNAQARQLQLEAGDLAALDQAFQAPQRKQRLAMV